MLLVHSHPIAKRQLSGLCLAPAEGEAGEISVLLSQRAQVSLSVGTCYSQVDILLPCLYAKLINFVVHEDRKERRLR